MGCNCSLKCPLNLSLPLSLSPPLPPLSFPLSLLFFILPFLPPSLSLPPSLPSLSLPLNSPFFLSLGLPHSFPPPTHWQPWEVVSCLRLLLLQRVVLCPHSLPQFCWIKFSVVYCIDHFWPVCWTQWLKIELWHTNQSGKNPSLGSIQWFILATCVPVLLWTLGENHTSVMGITMNSSSMVSHLHSALHMWLPCSVHTPILHRP